MTKYTGRAEVVQQKIFNISKRNENGNVCEYVVVADDIPQALSTLKLYIPYEPSDIEGVQQMRDFDGVLVRYWMRGRKEDAAPPVIKVVREVYTLLHCCREFQYPQALSIQENLRQVLIGAGEMVDDAIEDEDVTEPLTNHANGSWQHDGVSLLSPMADVDIRRGMPGDLY